MKRITYIILTLLLTNILFTSCSEDDPPEPTCTAPSIEENIIGTWNVLADGDKPASVVVFNADGTGMDNSGMGVLSIDPCSSLGEEEEDLVSEFEWELDPFIGASINIAWFANNCISNTTFQTGENSCDKIIISHPFFRNNVVMERQ